MFCLDDNVNKPMKRDLEQLVEEAIASMIRHDVPAADVTFKLGIRMISAQAANGKRIVYPKYEYKGKYTISAGSDGEKGEADSEIAMWRDEDGYWHEMEMDRQLSLVE